MVGTGASLGLLKNDLATFKAELEKIDALPPDRAAKARAACEQHFADLPARIQDAILNDQCVFVERSIAGDQWRYLLQHGDVVVCDHIPGHMRDAILKPIVRHLTPLGGGSDLLWYCM